MYRTQQDREREREREEFYGEISSGVVAMELNTPNKTQTASLSQFEDSPVFKYINNLSPIELVKSVRIDQTYNTLSLVSPQSVFASPQIASLRDTTRSFIKRHQLSEISKLEAPLNRVDGSTGEGVAEIGSSGKEVTVEPPSGELEPAIELPKGLKHDCASPDGNLVPVNAIRDDIQPETENQTDEGHCLYGSDKDLRRIGQIGKNEHEAECDWAAMISEVDGILNTDSAMPEEHSEEQKMVDPGTISFISNVLQVPQDHTDNLEHTDSGCCVSSPIEGETEGKEMQQMELEGQKATNESPISIPDTPLTQRVVDMSTAKLDVKGKKGSQCSRKQDKIRRRCLVFEMIGGHKRKSFVDSNSSSLMVSQSEREGVLAEEDSTPGKIEKLDALSKPSGKGFGLHLNALATSSMEGKFVKLETSASGKQEIMDLVSRDNKHDAVDTDAQPLAVASEDFSIISPNVKSLKVEHVGAACKRCNCKRSKCLKLYCECFAAGLYCIEPCSCRDCFNNPAHENTVLETRKQIESRNPLAFAPKVIRSTDFISEYGDETNKTPASARHKTGCNCKKSSCLKKYCECFQGGVGCSSSCRCEGCKNTFGSKNGYGENDIEVEESETHDKNASEVILHDDMIKKGSGEHLDVPVPSSASDRGQPSGCSLPAIGPSVKNCDGRTLRTTHFFYSQTKSGSHLEMIPEDASKVSTSDFSCNTGVKSGSPNSKRITSSHHGFGSSATWRTGKFILRSVPPFPSLNSPCDP